MGKLFIPILIVAALAAAGFATVVLMSNQHKPVKQDTGSQSGSVTNPPSVQSKPSVKNTPKKANPKTVANDQPEKKKTTAQKQVQKPESGDKKQSQRPAQNRNQPISPRPQREYVMRLTRMVINIGKLENNEKYALTSDQAKQVLDVLTPLRAKPKLTEEDAREAYRSLERIFTADQINAVTHPTSGISPSRRPRQERQPSGAPAQSPQQAGQDKERPVAPPPGANRQPRQGLRMIMDFNPFYAKAPSDNNRMRAMVERMDEFFAALEKKAKSK